MVNMRLLAAFAVVGSAQLVSAQDNKIPCNSASHCSSISTNCMPCPPFKKEDGSYVPDEECNINNGPGACASTVALTKNPNSDKEVRYGVPYTQRCRRIVDASVNEKSATPEHSYYVKMCREGMFTCNTGYCQPIAGYPSECYGGILNSGRDEDVDHPCNIFYPEGRALLSPIWAGITGNKQSLEDKYAYMHEHFCLDHGGIRAHPFRCENADIGEGIASTDCASGIEVGRVCDEDNSVVSSITGPGDACYDECREEGEEENIPGCCVVPGNDVCSSVTIKTETTPPQEDAHGNEANGVELAFEFSPPDILGDSDDCCCEFICTCFGDPHCSSFFGDYQVSQDNSGSYSMINDPGEEFIVDVGLSAPGGVNQDFTVTIGADVYVIDAERCVYDQPQKKNGADFDVDTEPGFTYSHTSPTNSNADLSVNPAILVIQHGSYTLRLTCIRFEMTLGPNKGWYNRIDATLKLKDVLVPEGTSPECCPTMEAAFNEITQRTPRVGGFCVRTRGSTEDGLPNPRDPSTLGINRRLLHEQAVRGVSASAGRMPGRHLEIEGFLTPDDKKKLMNILKITQLQLELVAQDFGVESLQETLDYYNANCKYLATDDVFKLSNKGPCDEGLTVERSIDGGAFEPILFLPADVNYCDNKIFIPFEFVSPPLEKDHEIRLTLCQPDVNDPQCEGLFDKCQRTTGVEGIAVAKYTYDIGYHKTLKALYEHAATECECVETYAAKSDCFRQCILKGDCPPVGNCDA